jgi:muramoyltetrapeptide carboxypeptidase
MAYIEQSALMGNVVGLIIGHYAEEVPETLYGVLTRFAERHNIPAVYTDDFGHGNRHAILPIGMNATLDADAQSLVFEGVMK